MKTINIRIDEKLLRNFDATVESLGAKRAPVIRLLMRDYLTTSADLLSKREAQRTK